LRARVRQRSRRGTIRWPGSAAGRRRVFWMQAATNQWVRLSEHLRSGKRCGRMYARATPSGTEVAGVATWARLQTPKLDAPRRRAGVVGGPAASGRAVARSAASVRGRVPPSQATEWLRAGDAVEIAFYAPREDWVPAGREVERLRAITLGDGRFRIETVPVVAAGVSRAHRSRRRVRAVLRFGAVVEESGHSTLRVLVYAGDARQFMKPLDCFGGVYAPLPSGARRLHLTCRQRAASSESSTTSERRSAVRLRELSRARRRAIGDCARLTVSPRVTGSRNPTRVRLTGENAHPFGARRAARARLPNPIGAGRARRAGGLARVVSPARCEHSGRSVALIVARAPGRPRQRGGECYEPASAPRTGS
jgi:hypothetical protein